MFISDFHWISWFFSSQLDSSKFLTVLWANTFNLCCLQNPDSQAKIQSSAGPSEISIENVYSRLGVHGAPCYHNERTTIELHVDR